MPKYWKIQILYKLLRAKVGCRTTWLDFQNIAAWCQRRLSNEWASKPNNSQVTTVLSLAACISSLTHDS